MIACILVDDEPNNLESLQQLIAGYFPRLAVKAIASNSEDAIREIRNYKPDLLFLDIQMPLKNGFELLESLPEIDFEVIFVTAYDQYGIQAIKFSALDYLLKPVDIRELTTAVGKAEARIMEKKRNFNLENLLTNLKDARPDALKIALPVAQETRFVSIGEIVRCQADNNYTEIFLSSGETLVVSKTLKEYEELLSPYHFLRSHQSHVVNTHHVKSMLREDGGVLLMADGAKIPISRQKREQVKAALTKLI